MARADAGGVTAAALRKPSALALALAARAAALARSLPWQPWSVLAPLVLVQWAAVAVFALTVRHNGWLFYQGGDESAYYTTAWSLGHAYLPVTPIGWGWSTLLSPVAAIAGPSFLSALPAIVVLQTVLLLPVAVVSVYAIAARLGGRLLGYLAGAAWIAAPFAVILVADPRYHERWVEQFLPQALGLTGLADFPSMVALLAGAALILRALADGGRANTLLAGLVVSFAIGIKPANALFLVGAALAFLLARRFGQALLFGAALVPGLVALAVWKQRGLGELPLFALGTHTLAAGGGPTGWSLPRPPSLLGSLLGATYIDIKWSRIDQNLIALREFFWNTRLYQVLPFIGLVAVLRRSRPAAGLLAGWFAAFFVVKGTNQYATVDSGSFFRFLLPALPAYLLLAAAIPLLVPVAGRHMAATGAALRGPRLARPRTTVAAVAAVLGVIPLLLFVAAPHLPAGKAVKYFQNATYVPVAGPAPTATVSIDGKVSLSWARPATGGIGVWFKVMRSLNDPVSCQSTGGGTIDCAYSQNLDVLATGRTTAYDDKPGPGTWWYSVGVVANWLDDSTKGDVLLLLQAVRVDVS